MKIKYEITKKTTNFKYHGTSVRFYLDIRTIKDGWFAKTLAKLSMNQRVGYKGLRHGDSTLLLPPYQDDVWSHKTEKSAREALEIVIEAIKFNTKSDEIEIVECSEIVI